jgi:hypothetical protein
MALFGSNLSEGFAEALEHSFRRKKRKCNFLEIRLLLIFRPESFSAHISFKLLFKTKKGEIDC